MSTLTKIVIAGVTLATIYLAAVVYSVGARSEEAPKVATPAVAALSADYQKGWCAGWKAAAEAVTARRNLWRSNMEAVSPIDKWPQTMISAMTAIDAFILVPPITGKVQLADKTEIDCGAK